MTTVVDVLRERGYPGVDEESLVRAVQDLLPTRSAMVAVTDGERRFMAAHSGVQVTGEAVSGAVGRLVARRITQAAQTMDTGAVVDLLGVHRTRVQHLLEAGDLYAYRDGRRNRFPLWQFTNDGRPLPGLRVVLAALGSAHRSVVNGFMSTPQPDLDNGDGPMNARDWLSGGGDPVVVVELARGVRDGW